MPKGKAAAKKGNGARRPNLRAAMTSLRGAVSGAALLCGKEQCRFPVWLFWDDAPRAWTWVSRWLAAACVTFRDHFGKYLFCVLSFDERSGFEGLVYQEGICQHKKVSTASPLLCESDLISQNGPRADGQLLPSDVDLIYFGLSPWARLGTQVALRFTRF